MILLPLKRRLEPALAIIAIIIILFAPASYFRTRESAAPLKHANGVGARGATPQHFHTRESAASLKPDGLHPRRRVNPNIAR